MVYIDKQGGVDLIDCETVSLAIEPLIDEADPIEHAYVFCVSSPGIDRPLKSRGTMSARWERKWM